MMYSLWLLQAVICAMLAAKYWRDEREGLAAVMLVAAIIGLSGAVLNIAKAVFA